jgi:hypothetical protein
MWTNRLALAMSWGSVGVIAVMVAGVTGMRSRPTNVGIPKAPNRMA